MFMRILLVEDDPAVVRLLERGLTLHGYGCLEAGTGADGIRLALEEAVDLVLLDISLPGLGGLEVLKRIRDQKPALPVMMLTARDDIAAKVGTLESGADDYLTKPFVFEELLARIRTLHRRANLSRNAFIRAGDLTIDSARRQVWRGEHRISLSATEFDLIEHLALNSGKVLSRSQMFEAVWGYDFDPGSNAVDVYVRYLRRKLDRPGEPSVIATVRGEGYRFDLPASGS